MFLVATVDRNWAIGKNGKLLYEIPMDLIYFNELIKDHITVCGRKSYEDIYRKKQLAAHRDLVLSKNPHYACDGTTIHSITELYQFPTNDIYVIGGSSVYQQLYTQCKYAFITQVDSVTLDSDAFFPNLSLSEQWHVINATPILYYQGLPYTFVTYRNDAVT